MSSQTVVRFHCWLICLTSLACLLAFSRPATAAVAWGDFDGNGFKDLAIGCPEADFIRPDGTIDAEAGLVHVIYADENGLNANNKQTLTRGSDLNGSRAGFRFGTALAVGDFNDDDTEDLIT